MKLKKIKSYTALIMALSLANPAGVFATEANDANEMPDKLPLIEVEETAETTNKNTTTEENTTDTETEKQETEVNTPAVETPAEVTTKKAYDTSLKMKLSNDGKKIVYELTINKNTDNPGKLNAYIYLPKTSNIENIKLYKNDNDNIEIDSIKERENYDFYPIKIKDGQSQTIEFEADIKEGKTDRLFFDLALVDDENNFKSSKRSIGNLASNGDNLELKETVVESIASVLDGKFIDSRTISWSDYLLNDSDNILKLDYPLEISPNQSTADQKLAVTAYKLTADGFIIDGESQNLDLKGLEALEIKPHSLVKINFNTKVSEEEGEFTVNGVVAKKLEQPTSPTNKEEVVDEEAEIDQLKEEIKEVKEAIESELEAIEAENLVEKGAELPEVKALDKITAPQNEEKTTAEEDKETYKKDEEEPSPIDKLTDDLNSNTASIKEELQNADVDESLLAKTAEPTPANVVEVKTMVLLDNGNKEQTDITRIEDPATDVDKAVEEVAKAKEEIEKILVDNNLAQPPTPKAEVGKKPALIEKIKKAVGPEKLEDLDTLEALITEITNTNKEIVEVLETVGVLQTKDSVIRVDKPTNIEDIDKIIDDIKKAHEEINEVIRQVELVEETKVLKNNPDELSKVRALIGDLTTLNEAAKQVKEQAAGKVDKQTDEDYISQGFKLVVDGYSKTAYKELQEVVTITLDPLKKVTPSTNVEEAKKKYPSIAYYLSNLNLRHDLIKNVK